MEKLHSVVGVQMYHKVVEYTPTSPCTAYTCLAGPCFLQDDVAMVEWQPVHMADFQTEEELDWAVVNPAHGEDKNATGQYMQCLHLFSCRMVSFFFFFFFFFFNN